VVQRNTRQTLLLIGLPVVLVAYLFTGCYCTVSSPNRPLKVISHSQGCVVVNMPEPWLLADGQTVYAMFQSLHPVIRSNGDVVHYEDYRFNRYEVRRSRSDPDVFFVALHNSFSSGQAPVSLTSKNKFAFRWRYVEGAVSARVDGLQRASDHNWENAIPLTENTQNVDGPKPWYHTGSYLESHAGRYVELSRSKGGGYQSHGFLDLGGLFWDIIYNPPEWTHFEIYSVAGRKQIGAATIRSCDTSLLQHAAWHGESVFTIPISNDQRNILLCRTAEPSEPENVTAADTVSEPGPVARILSLAEAQLDQDHNGRTDVILFDATVNVTLAGSYQMMIELKGSNGQETNQQTSMSLQPGIRHMWVSFPTAEVKYIGADGPYQRKAVLIYNGTDFLTSTLDAGPSFPYRLHALDGPEPESP
jgi:hypothetical protein